jgi:hypothetical protein
MSSKTALTSFDAFKALTEKIISVSKKVVDEREKQWKKSRKAKASLN